MSRWVIHVCLGLGRTVIHFRFAPKATVVRTLQIRRFVPITTKVHRSNMTSYIRRR